MAVHFCIPHMLLVATCYTIAVLCSLVYLILLPIRLFKRTVSPRTSASPPKVTLTTHEPCSPNTTPKGTILFVHGFPDCSDIFDAQVTKLTTEGYRCLVAALPGSRGEPVAVALEPSQVAELVRDAVQAVHPEPLTIIAHDWGAFYAMFLVKKYPDSFRRVVLIDVGGVLGAPTSTKIAMMAYQGMLALMYALGPTAGTLGVKAFLAYSGYNARPLKEITADMCYTYLGVMRFLLKGKKTKDLPRASQERLKQIPHLFIYGTKKIFMFHDEDWIDFVRSTPEGQVVGMPCGHWVHVDRPEECNLLISQWLERAEKALCHAGAAAGGVAEDTEESVVDSVAESKVEAAAESAANGTMGATAEDTTGTATESMVNGAAESAGT